MAANASNPRWLTVCGQVALDLSNYAFVRNYVTKAESALEALHAPPQGGKPKAPVVNLPGMLAPERDPHEIAKEKEKQAMHERLAVAGGVASLGYGAYDKAARAFTGIGKEALETKEGHFIPPADIALYATVTGLASFTRNELKTRLLENGDLRPMLDLEPYLRDIIRAFYNNQFKEGLASLAHHRVSALSGALARGPELTFAETASPRARPSLGSALARSRVSNPFPRLVVLLHPLRHSLDLSHGRRVRMGRRCPPQPRRRIDWLGTHEGSYRHAGESTRCQEKGHSTRSVQARARGRRAHPAQNVGSSAPVRGAAGYWSRAY